MNFAHIAGYTLRRRKKKKKGNLNSSEQKKTDVTISFHCLNKIYRQRCAGKRDL